MKQHHCLRDFIRRTALAFSLTAAAAGIIPGFSAAVYARPSVVKMGHATIGENGSTAGTQPGDQTGREVRQATFKYTEGTWAGWDFVARPKDVEAAKVLAKAMKQACKNNNIGYGKDGPSVYKAAKAVDFNMSAIATPVNGDCFMMFRTCAAAAGIDIWPEHLKNSDTFTIFTGMEYRSEPTLLQPGDVLVTLNQKNRHVAVVVSSPNRAEGAEPNPVSSYTAGTRYKLLEDQYVQVGPGSSYFRASFDDLSPEGQEIAGTDQEGTYAMISAGTTVTCLEGRRNWIRTQAGWIRGDQDGEMLVRER